MWLATGHIGADLSKTFSKKSLEIVLEAEILARSEVSSFGNDKTPKTIEFTGFFDLSKIFSTFFPREMWPNSRFSYL